MGAVQGGIYVGATNKAGGMITVDKKGATRFHVFMAKAEGDRFGLVTMPMQDGSRCLVIIEIREGGLVARWNSQQQQLGELEKMLNIGDRIVSVADDIEGGSTTNLDEMRRLLKRDRVEFSLERSPSNV